MNNQGGPPPHKGPRWILDQIAAAFEASRGGPPSAGQPLSRGEVNELVTEALEEELERLEGTDEDTKDIKDSKDEV